MTRRNDGVSIVAFAGAVVIALFVLIAVVACNDTGSSTYNYPQDSSHGYYDTHHHYHYYPKYNKGSKYYVVPSKPKPAPAPQRPSKSFRKR